MKDRLQFSDQTKSTEFEITAPLHQHCLVPVDGDILNRAQQIAHTRGLSTGNLVNLLLEQRL